jgi:hypothetical protein
MKKKDNGKKTAGKLSASNAQRTPRGTFALGNAGGPGRPKGSRNKVTELVEALLDGEAEGLTRRLITLAKRGNASALSIVFNRLCPSRRDRTISIDLSTINDTADLLTAHALIIAAAARGELSPSEAASMTSMLGQHRQASEAARFEERLRALEARSKVSPSR